MGGIVNTEVLDWYQRHTTPASHWDPDTLVRRKTGHRVSVVLPALNEERTVGAVVSVFREVAEATGLVDEIVVMDSGSTDATRQVALHAGADVHHRDEVLPHLGSHPGKGEVLWKSLAVTTGDIIVFCDADLLSVGPTYLTGLIGPLLHSRETAFVKACYDRPLRTDASAPALTTEPTAGRVTELVARPLLNLYFPMLAGVVQPLGGEYAARRHLLETLPFTAGYGVDVGLLIDAWRAGGLESIAQVDLGTRTHRHQSEQALGRMASHVVQAIVGRTAGGPEVSTDLTQFERRGDHFVPETTSVAVATRPPMSQVQPGAPLRVAGL